MRNCPAFWLEPAGRWRRVLRVDAPCGHTTEQEYQQGEGGPVEMRDTPTDWEGAPWPANCSTCGEPINYDHDDTWQVISGETYYRREDTGEEGTLKDFGPGAMWDASPWHGKSNRPDGRYIVARTPDGHDWHIDSKASNCDRPNEEHDCWCRHGEPPKLTVNNVPEPGRSTCTAGSGSIRTPDWHGFLTDGVFVEHP